MTTINGAYRTMFILKLKFEQIQEWLELSADHKEIHISKLNSEPITSTSMHDALLILKQNSNKLNSITCKINYKDSDMNVHINFKRNELLCTVRNDKLKEFETHRETVFPFSAISEKPKKKTRKGRA